MIVTGFFKESPAAKAGIKIGDEVLKINSLDTGSLSMLEVMNILTDDQNRDVELMYLENGALKNVTLHKANLLPEYGKESLQKPTIGP